VPIINLTPHSVLIFEPNTPDRIFIEQLNDYLVVKTFLASSEPLRLKEEYVGNSSVDDQMIYNVQYGHLTFEPPQEPDTYYIVSIATALACRGWRTDFLVPYLEVRNIDGTVIGCRALARPV